MNAAPPPSGWAPCESYLRLKANGDSSLERYRSPDDLSVADQYLGIISVVKERFLAFTSTIFCCGRALGRALFLLQTVWMGGMAICYFADGSILVASFFLSFSIFWSYVAIGRLQICEGGIKLHGLLQWSKIKSYQWKEGETPTLLVQTDAILSWYSRGAYPIPVKHRDEVGAVLKQKVGARHLLIKHLEI